MVYVVKKEMEKEFVLTRRAKLKKDEFPSCFFEPVACVESCKGGEGTSDSKKKRCGKKEAATVPKQKKKGDATSFGTDGKKELLPCEAAKPSKEPALRDKTDAHDELRWAFVVGDVELWELPAWLQEEIEAL